VHTAQGRLTGLDSEPACRWCWESRSSLSIRHDEHFVDAANRHQAAVGLSRHDVLGGLIIRQIVNMEV
jgi:hypothetical protein